MSTTIGQAFADIIFGAKRSKDPRSVAQVVASGKRAQAAAAKGLKAKNKNSRKLVAHGQKLVQKTTAAARKQDAAEKKEQLAKNRPPAPVQQQAAPTPTVAPPPAQAPAKTAAPTKAAAAPSSRARTSVRGLDVNRISSFDRGAGGASARTADPELANLSSAKVEASMEAATAAYEADSYADFMAIWSTMDEVCSQLALIPAAAQIVAEGQQIMALAAGGVNADGTNYGDVEPDFEAKANEWLPRAREALANPAGIPGSGAMPVSPMAGAPFPWQPNHQFPIGTNVTTGMNLYAALRGGTTGMTPPTAMAPQVPDGQVLWQYLGPDPMNAQMMAQQPFMQPGGGFDAGGYGGGGGGMSSGEDPFGPDLAQDSGGMMDDLPMSSDPFASSDGETGGEMDATDELERAMQEEGDQMATDVLADDEMLGVVMPYRPNWTTDQQVTVDASMQRLKDARAALAAARAARAAAGLAPVPPGPAGASFAERLAEAQQNIYNPAGGEFADPSDPFAEETMEGLGDRSKSDLTVEGQDIDEAFDKAVAEMVVMDTFRNLLSSRNPPASNANTEAVQQGLEVLGAAARPTAPPRVTAKQTNKSAVWTEQKKPSGAKIISQTPVKPNVGDVKRTVAVAQDVARRAIAVGEKLKKAAAAQTAVHGIYGVAPRPAARGRRRMTNAQLVKVAEKVIKDGKALAKQASKYGTQATAHAAAVSTGVKKLGAYVQSAGATSLRGLEVAHAMHAATAEVLGHEAMVQSIIGATVSYSQFQPAAMPMQQQSGVAQPMPFDPSGGYYEDPNAGYATDPNAAAVPVDPNQAASPGMGGDPAEVLSDPNAGQGPMPTLDTLPPPPHMKDPGSAGDQTAYTDLPIGAILYDGSRLGGNDAIGSWYVFYGNGSGFKWNDSKKHWYGHWGDWDGNLNDWGCRDPECLVRDWPQRLQHSERASGTSSFDEVNRLSLKAGWGPLIGNPKVGDLKGLRYAGGDRFFWFWDTAPQWAKMPSDQLRLAQAITDWQAAVTAAKTDAAAQIAQEQLDREQSAAMTKQQAAEDAAMARQQAQEQARAEADAKQQAIADETAQRRQAAADDAMMKQMAAQAEIDRAAAESQGRMDLEAARLQAELAMQRGEMPGGGGGGEMGDEQDPGVDYQGPIRETDGDEEFSGLAGLKRRLGVT